MIYVFVFGSTPKVSKSLWMKRYIDRNKHKPSRLTHSHTHLCTCLQVHTYTYIQTHIQIQIHTYIETKSHIFIMKSQTAFLLI